MTDPTRGDAILADSGFCQQCGDKMPCAKHHAEGQETSGGLNESLNIEGAGALIKIEIAGLSESFDALGKKWIKKPEFHVTMVGFATKLDKLCKEHFVLSNADAKIKAQEILRQAAEGIQFKIKLKDEYRRAERGEDRTIIQLCDVDGMDDYFKAIEAQLDGKSIERPPAHITLYTGENGQAIGLPTQAKFEELARPLVDEDLREIRAGIGQ